MNLGGLHLAAWPQANVALIIDQRLTAASPVARRLRRDSAAWPGNVISISAICGAFGGRQSSPVGAFVHRDAGPLSGACAFLSIRFS